MKMTKHEIIFCICFALYIIAMAILDAFYNGKPIWYGIIWGVGLIATGVISITLADFLIKKWGE